jgi:hypothetical protein
LQRCNRFPDFNNYLTFILCRAEVLNFSPTHLMFSLVGSPPPPGNLPTISTMCLVYI